MLSSTQQRTNGQRNKKQTKIVPARLTLRAVVLAEDAAAVDGAGAEDPAVQVAHTRPSVAQARGQLGAHRHCGTDSSFLINGLLGSQEQKKCVFSLDYSDTIYIYIYIYIYIVYSYRPIYI